MRHPIATWSLRRRLTFGIVLLTAAGYVISGVIAQQALKGYLLHQVDSQLVALSGGTLPRVAAFGIADSEDWEENREMRQKNRPLRITTPLQRIPTSTSITLLNSDGVVLAELGGDLNSSPIANYLGGLSLRDVANLNGEAFTVEGTRDDFRAIALLLPNDAGSVVAAQSLGDLNRTVDRLGLLFLLIGLLLLALITIATRLVIRIGMRPLKDVEVTAGEIAGGNLSVRMPDANPDTEVGRLVTALNAMLSRIESSFAARLESENRLRRFVADASHELRTPITAIRGFSELYRQGAIVGEEPTKNLVARIEGESVRMSTLVEDLLLLARLDQAREMEMNPLDLVEIADVVISSARVSAPHHKIIFDRPDHEIFILGDAPRVHQVIANLLANAGVHTPAGSEIHLSIEQTANGAELSVADNGPGLSPDAQSKIFQRFYRADPSRARVDGEGSGLGLSIVDAVMRAHGGSVSVQSELGRGAKFTLFFPVSN
jgi:two-component system, OmpR family, sensor kinase